MTKLADKIKEALKAGRSGQFATKTPYERFGFTQNPFRHKVDPNSPEFQIDREDVLLEFAIKVGNAIRWFEDDPSSPFRYLLTHGLRGVGKSFLANHFDREWDQIGFHDYETLYVDLAAWREPIELQEQYGSSTKTLDTYEKFLFTLNLAEKPLIIFIDSLDYTITGTPAIPRIRNFISDIEERAQNGVIIIGFVDSLTLSVLLEDEQKLLSHSFLSVFNPECFFFPVFSKSEIRKLIVQRTRIARSPTELFSTKSIELISDHSLGIPTLALKIATDCMNELIVQDLDKVTARVVTTVLNQFGYTEAVRIAESVDKDSDEETTSIITPKRREIIAAILGHQSSEEFFFPATGVDGLRSSDLAELFGVNLSTINYHIKPLTSTLPIPILDEHDDVHDARSKIFYVNWESPLAHALEIITVFHRLKHEKYQIKRETILLSRRSNL
ncbi:MAG: hypothetical protein ACXAC8_10410 [Candidatus Hodarchaeales archaeon]|jgi:hypothetical protein